MEKNQAKNKKRTRSTMMSFHSIKLSNSQIFSVLIQFDLVNGLDK